MSDPSPNPPEEINLEATKSEAATEAPGQARALDEAPDEAMEIPLDPEAQAADRAGFKFLAVGFLFFFVIIAVCAGVVALVMKNMGI